MNFWDTRGFWSCSLILNQLGKGHHRHYATHSVSVSEAACSELNGLQWDIICLILVHPGYIQRLQTSEQLLRACLTCHYFSKMLERHVVPSPRNFPSFWLMEVGSTWSQCGILAGSAMLRAGLSISVSYSTWSVVGVMWKFSNGSCYLKCCSVVRKGTPSWSLKLETFCFLSKELPPVSGWCEQEHMVTTTGFFEEMWLWNAGRHADTDGPSLEQARLQYSAASCLDSWRLSCCVMLCT